MFKMHTQENVLVATSLLQSYFHPSSVLWVIRLMESVSSSRKAVGSVCYQCAKSTVEGD